MKTTLLSIALLAAVTALGAPATPATVLLFVVDGVEGEVLQVAVANGARNFKLLMDQGVWVQEVYCPSPAPRAFLPDGSVPWQTASGPNVAMHTGTHVYESRSVDDIFFSARRAGINSVFAGGAISYDVFTTPDHYYSGKLPDTEVVRRGLDHFRNDGVRLIRLHLQEMRDHWTGPRDKLDPNSGYQRHLLKADALLGECITAFKQAGTWDHTYIIAASDHGMGATNASNHPPSVLSSWKPFIIFFGPGIRQGASIPYAELPDIAIMTNHFLGLPPLEGFTGSETKIPLRRTTGTFLANVFEGSRRELNHPALIRKYLASRNWAPPDDYADYRTALLSLLEEITPAN